MRLIDADALINELNNSHYPGAPYIDAGISIAIGKVCDAPTIEPERKKGMWIPVTNGRGGHECDQCHGYAPSYQIGEEHLSDFCPNCGADMRTPVETAKDIVHEAIDNSVWSDTVDTAKMHKVVDNKYAEMTEGEVTGMTYIGEDGDADADVES